MPPKPKRSQFTVRAPNMPTNMAGSGARIFGTLQTSTSLHMQGNVYDSIERAYLYDYERAIRNDPFLYRSMWFIANALVASLGAYSHPDKDIQEFMNKTLREMQGDIKQTLREVVYSSLWSGHSMAEMVLQPKGATVVLAKTLVLHPASTRAVLDEKGMLTEGKKAGLGYGVERSGLYQQVDNASLTQASVVAGTNLVRLPMIKTALVAHNSRHGNVLGESILTPIWSQLEWLRFVNEQMLTTTERYGSPQVAVIVPRATTREDVVEPGGTRRKKSLAESTSEQMARLNSSNGVVLEEPVGLPGDNKIRLQNISSFNNFGDNYLNIIHDYYKTILVGMGVPPLLFLENEGAISVGPLATIHAETFKQTLVSLYEQLIVPFVEQTLGRIVFWNFGDSDPGSFDFAPYDIASVATMMATFEKAVEYGAIDMEEAEDLDLVRSRLNLPPISQESRERRLRRNKEIMARVRKPDMDKQAIARERNATSENIAGVASDTQLQVAKQQGANMRAVAKLNAEAKANQPAPKPPGR